MYCFVLPLVLVKNMLLMEFIVEYMNINKCKYLLSFWNNLPQVHWCQQDWKWTGFWGVVAVGKGRSCPHCCFILNNWEKAEFKAGKQKMFNKSRGIRVLLILCLKPINLFLFDRVFWKLASSYFSFIPELATQL